MIFLQLRCPRMLRSQKGVVSSHPFGSFTGPRSQGSGSRKPYTICIPRLPSVLLLTILRQRASVDDRKVEIQELFIRTFLSKSQFSSRHLLPNMFCSETLTLFQLCGILPSFVSHDVSSGRVEGEKQLRPRPLVGSTVAEVNTWTSRLGRVLHQGNCCDW